MLNMKPETVETHMSLPLLGVVNWENKSCNIEV